MVCYKNKIDYKLYKYFFPYVNIKYKRIIYVIHITHITDAYVHMYKHTYIVHTYAHTYKRTYHTYYT